MLTGYHSIEKVGVVTYLDVNVVFQLFIGRRRFIFQIFVKRFVGEVDFHTDIYDDWTTIRANIKNEIPFIFYTVFYTFTCLCFAKINLKISCKILLIEKIRLFWWLIAYRQGPNQTVNYEGGGVHIHNTCFA